MLTKLQSFWLIVQIYVIIFIFATKKEKLRDASLFNLIKIHHSESISKDLINSE